MCCKTLVFAILLSCLSWPAVIGSRLHYIPSSLGLQFHSPSFLFAFILSVESSSSVVEIVKCMLWVNKVTPYRDLSDYRQFVLDTVVKYSTVKLEQNHGKFLHEIERYFDATRTPLRLIYLQDSLDFEVWKI